MTTIYSDAPIAGASFDTLGRIAVADRLLELATFDVVKPVVVGLLGRAGSGKTSILRMLGESCAARGEIHAFSIDAWVARTASAINDAFLKEVFRIFEAEGVLGQTDRVRDKLFAVGDVVSAVARFAGASVDLRGGLERSDDAQRTKIIEHAQVINKRIVVGLDHVERMPATEVATTIKQLVRWGTFPYFAFVISADRELLARKLREADGNTDDLERAIGVELPLPDADREALAATIRGGLIDLASARGIDPDPALALFDLDTGIGLDAITTPRAAKRLLNTLGAAAPLAPAGLDLRRACLIAIVRHVVPEAMPAIASRLGALGDPDQTSALAERLAGYATRHAQPELVERLFAALLAPATVDAP